MSTTGTSQMIDYSLLKYSVVECYLLMEHLLLERVLKNHKCLILLFTKYTFTVLKSRCLSRRRVSGFLDFLLLLFLCQDKKSKQWRRDILFL